MEEPENFFRHAPNPLSAAMCIWREEVITPGIPDLSTKCGWVVSAAIWGRFTPGKSPRYLLLMRLGGPQNRSVRFGEEKNSRPCRDKVLLAHQKIWSELLAHHTMWSELLAHYKTWSELLTHHKMWSEFLAYHKVWSELPAHHKMWLELLAHYKMWPELLAHHNVWSELLVHHKVWAELLAHHKVWSKLLAHHRMLSELDRGDGKNFIIRSIRKHRSNDM